MKPNITTTCLICLLTIGMPMSAWSSDAKSDKAQAEQQAASLPAIQKAIVDLTGYEANNVGVKSTAHLVTITVANSKLNSAKRIDRETEAQNIAVAVEKTISDKAEYSQVGAIHVDYVKGKLAKGSRVQGIDFNKTATGSFQIHKS